MDIILKIIILLQLLSGGSFDSFNSCPPPVLWRIVGRETCQDETHFHCLLNDSANEIVKMCFKPVHNPAGSSIVLDKFLNAERCRDDRYQPRPYWSNQFNKCVYKKSLCNEKGQVIGSSGPGTFTVDRTCRCDYRRGYAFITTPKNRCYCIPSEEDCGCYIKPCPNSSYYLSSGYECVNDHTPTTTCSAINDPSLPPEVDDNQQYRVLEYDNMKYNIQKIADVDKQSAVIVIIITIIIGIIFSGVILVYELHAVSGRDYYDDPIFLPPSTIKRLTAREIKHMKNSDTFISTNGYLKAQTALRDKDVTLIKGRYGTGKTMTALMLASYYVDRGYEPYKLDTVNINTIKQLMGSKKARVIILENIIGDTLQYSTDLTKLKNVISFLFGNRAKTKIILTTYLTNHELWEIFIQNFSRCQDAFVDFDEKDALTVQEKKSILRNHSNKHHRNIANIGIDDIVKCSPIVGFPLMCCMFCSDDNYFAMGMTFFTQIPIALLEKLEQLRDNGIDLDFEGMKFSVLVYMSLGKDQHVSFHASNINLTMFKTIYQSVYKKEFTHGLTSLENAANTFRGQYLDRNEFDEFTFRHPVIKQAILIIYGKISPKNVVEKAAVEDLLYIVRPGNWRTNLNEPVLRFDAKEDYNVFMQRVGQECFENESAARTIGIYVRDFVKDCNENNMMEVFLKVLRQQLETDTKNFIACLVIVFQEITSRSSNCLQKDVEPVQFRLLWEIVCAATNFNEDALKQLVQICLDLNIQNEILFSVMDEFNNTLLHYLVVWDYDESLRLINTTSALQALNTKNKLGFAPVYFAVHLARSRYLQLLLAKREKTTQSVLKTIKTKTKLGRKVIKLLSGGCTEDQAHFISLWEFLAEGETTSEQNILSHAYSQLKVNTKLIPSIQFGKQSDYQTSKHILLDFYPFAKKYLKKTGKDISTDDDFEDDFVMIEYEAVTEKVNDSDSVPTQTEEADNLIVQ